MPPHCELGGLQGCLVPHWDLGQLCRYVLLLYGGSSLSFESFSAVEDLTTQSF